MRAAYKLHHVWYRVRIFSLNKMPSTLYYGAVINPNEREAQKPISYEALPYGLIEVSDSGKIIRFDHIVPVIPEQRSDDSVVVLKPGEFIMPGLIDTHTVRAYLISMERIVHYHLMNLVACASISQSWNVSLG
jgi:hypothetical protein